MAEIYKPVKSVNGLECSRNGLFRYKGKPKKVIYSYIISGRKATARITIMNNGVSKYYQASRLIAETWLYGYNSEKYIIYKDGDLHNIVAGNLSLCDKKDYNAYCLRNSEHKAATLQERKKKLQNVINEATMTLNYFNTLDMREINNHVKDYLYRALMNYCIKTLYLGESVAIVQVSEAIARMYEVITNGMCLYNYERYCKKLLLNYKKNGSFGFTGNVPKPIQIEVEQLNLDCLWERFKVTKLK